MATCPTSSFNTTSAPTTSTPPTVPEVRSIDTSSNSSRTTVGRGTSTHVGDTKTAIESTQPPTQTSSQTAWKPASDRAFLSISTKLNVRTFSSYDEDEVAKHKDELEAYLQVKKEAEEQPKRKKKRREIVVSENHMKLRAAYLASAKWERELVSVHGLSAEERSLCFSLLFKYDRSESFPESQPDGKNQRWLDLTREGWSLKQKHKSLLAKYPQENCDQCYRDGVWQLREDWLTLKELEEEREAHSRKSGLGKGKKN